MGRKFDEHLERVGAQRIWLATIGGEVVGMVGVIQTEDEIELEPIVVSEQWRGRGIGRQLAERVVAEARAAGMGQLLARPVARNAARFASSTTSDSMRSASSNSCSISDPRPIRSGVWERRSLTAIYGLAAQASRQTQHQTPPGQVARTTPAVDVAVVWASVRELPNPPGAQVFPRTVCVKKDEVLVCDLRYKRPTQTQREFQRDARVFLWPP